MVRRIRLHSYTLRLNTSTLQIQYRAAQRHKGFEQYVGTRVRRAFEAHAQRESPVRTGRLRRSLRGRRTPRTIRIVSRVPYFLFVWRGTRYIRANRFVERAEAAVRRDLDAIVLAGIRRFPRAMAA